jgi:PAS domain S-box-containing protein
VQYEPDSLYLGIADALTDLIYLKGADHRFLRVNRAFVEAIGRPESQIVGTTEAELGFASRVVEVLHGEEDLVWKERTPRTQDCLVMKLGGRLRIFQSTLAPLLGADGRIRGVCGVLHDITDMKTMESGLHEALKMAEAYRSAVDAADIVVMTDSAGRVIHANDNFLRLTGYSREELIGVDSGHLGADPRDESLWAAVAREGIWRGEKRMQARSGAILWVDLTVVAVRADDGRIRSHLAIMHDITELKRQNGALIRSQRLFNSMLGQYPGMVFIKDGARRFLYVNQACCDFFGKPASELIGRTIPEISPAGEFAMSDSDERVIRGGLPVQSQEILPGPPPRYFESHKFPIVGEDGRLIGIGGVVVESTERVRALRELEEHRSRAIHSSKMATLGELAAGIAHEINNPLAVLLGNAERLDGLAGRAILASSPGVEPFEVRKVAEKLIQVCERITRIIQGLKGFARDGSRDPFVATSLSRVVGETLEFCSHRLKGRGVRFEVGAIPDVRIECRGVQISQVLLNLLNNGFDAVQDSPEAWVKVDAQVAAQVDGGRVELRVTDSGKGIPDPIAARIMEPFFTTKSPGQGTGLGLSIAQAIVREHRGELVLDRSGPHTRFVLSLPQAP